MKKLLLLFIVLLTGVSGVWADVTYYIPTNRVTTFDSEKVYMLYNTALNGDEDRTGFIYVDGGGSMQKYTSTNRNPKQFRTTSSAYLWKVVTGESNHVSLQNMSNEKYYGLHLGANQNDPNNLYLYQWGELPLKQSDANSQNEDDPSTKTANASITFATNKVFIIGNGSSTFWNGNVGDIVTYSDGHPFAFYEVEEVTVPSGYNGYIGSTKTIGATEWQTQSNWDLTDAWKGNGPGYNGSDMWSPIYLQDVTATGIEFEGWNLRLRLVNSSLTATTNKLQAGGTVTIDVDENSTFDLTMSGENGDPGLHTFNIDGTLIIKTKINHFYNTNSDSKSQMNLGTTGRFTFTADANVTTPRPFAINATLTDPTVPNTVESRTLATFTNVTVTTLTPSISAPDGWTKVDNEAALGTKTDGKYYWVEKNNSSGVTLKTYQFQVASKKQQAKDKVSPYEDYIGTGVGKYTVYLGETAYSTYSAFETAVDGWTTLGHCVEPTIAINQPTVGFYRFKAAARSANDNENNWYMGGNASGIYSASTTAAQASDANTIFYVEKDGDGYHPINYVTGLYSNGTANNTVGTKSNFTLTQAIKANNTDLLYGQYKLVNTGTSKTIVMWSNSYLNDINGNNDWSGWTIEPVESLPVTIGSAGFSTFYSPVNLTLDEGLTAYVGTITDRSTLTLISTDVIPANQGVILVGTAGDYTLTVGGTTDKTSSIKGSVAATTETLLGKEVLTLTSDAGSPVFKKFTGTTLTAFKGYILEEDVPASVKALTIEFLEDAIAALKAEKIQGTQSIYDLNGRRVERVQKGIYIINGRKVVIK